VKIRLSHSYKIYTILRVEGIENVCDTSKTEEM
jgi:hypothetical protein